MAKGRTKGVPVLMYHALEDEAHPAGAKDAGEQRYVLPVSQFREQMGFLHREGYRTFLLEELQELAEWPDKAVVLTFDDGHESNFILALPILQEYGFKSEFFITTGWIGTPYFMNEEQIRGLQRAGMGIGSHGVTHDFLDDMTVHECECEFRESMDTLRNITGEKVVSFSVPGGRIRSNVAELAERLGYSAVCTSQPGTMVKSSSPHSIPRFALLRDMEIQIFKSIVQLDEVYLSRLNRRNSILSIAKKMLGNRGYEKARRILLGNKDQ